MPGQTPTILLVHGAFAESASWSEVIEDLHRYMAERAGAEVSRELAGASHALSVSEPKAVTATILEAAAVP
jgi:hypothetical protein